MDKFKKYEKKNKYIVINDTFTEYLLYNRKKFRILFT